VNTDKEQEEFIETNNSLREYWEDRVLFEMEHIFARLGMDITDRRVWNLYENP
jgi:hypothetical protein